MTLATTIVVNDDDSSHDEDYADVIVITTTLHHAINAETRHDSTMAQYNSITRISHTRDQKFC